MIDLEESSSLLSLLGLLNTSEYFVTVDHSVLWQRHIAWSKPKGEDLRQYVTQRYASNMVFLSCMLAAQINVFFNSSNELTDMRSLLLSQSHGILRYWIGVGIISNICVTIIALVSTFTLWGMVSSISDANTHALLRSSIGQYVTGLPPKFTVAALYLFLLWISLFIYDLLKGPIQVGLLFLVLIMFFHVVIPLSAFGRLIIHTGAMADRPVLDKELEKELLPSGLHASLLIRATDRRRKYSSATDQYRKQNRGSKRGGSMHVPSISNAASSSLPSSSRYISSQPSSSNHCPPRNISLNRLMEDSDELTMDGSTSSLLQNPVDDEAMVTAQIERPARGHRRMETADTVGSDNFFFPGASVLNATTSRREIKDVVEKSVYLSSMGEDNTTNGSRSISMGSTGRMDGSDPSEIDAARAQAVTANHTEIVKEEGRPRHKRSTSDGKGCWRLGSGSSPKQGEHAATVTFDNNASASDGDQNVKTTILSPRLEESPTLSGRKHFFPLGTQPRDAVNTHPLLMKSPPPVPLPPHVRPPPHRPPKNHHHRRRSSSGRKSSSSILGFIREMEEENEVRALFDAPPAADLEAQGRLMDDFEILSQSQFMEEKTRKKELLVNRDGEEGKLGTRRTRPGIDELEKTPEEATHLLEYGKIGKSYV